MGPSFESTAQRQIPANLALRFDLLLKRTSGQRPHLRHYPHSVCDILVFFSNREEIVKGNTGSVESQLLYPTAVHCSRPNTRHHARHWSPSLVIAGLCRTRRSAPSAFGILIILAASPGPSSSLSLGFCGGVFFRFQLCPPLGDLLRGVRSEVLFPPIYPDTMHTTGRDI